MDVCLTLLNSDTCAKSPFPPRSLLHLVWTLIPPLPVDILLKLWDPVLGGCHSWSLSLFYLGSNSTCGTVPWGPLACTPFLSYFDSDSHARSVSAVGSDTPCLAILLHSHVVVRCALYCLMALVLNCLGFEEQKAKEDFLFVKTKVAFIIIFNDRFMWSFDCLLWPSWRQGLFHGYKSFPRI